MTRRVCGWRRWAAAVAVAAAWLGLAAGGCATPGAAFRAQLYESSPAVRAHDELHVEVVNGGADGLARRGGCAVCRY
jgi:hypothetical protein